ncbi:MAG: dihydrolipoyllysine-residue acetyltransferase [Pseudomonadales bacterium]|nr:dihydrolipoyllysine-residue acetyltransferase [Pseudomonadales bacterium]
MSIKEVTVPDIGGVDSVDVIEICVNIGDSVAQEDTWVVVESDKATVEVPSPFSGTIESLAIKVGDKIKEGDLIGTLKSQETAEAETQPAADTNQPEPEPEAPPAPQSAPSSQAVTSEIIVKVPDIGGAEEIEIIEVPVEEGTELKTEDTMIVLESDKATMEVPCPQDGIVTHVLVKVGDKVSEGSDVLKLKVTGSESTAAEAPVAPEPAQQISTEPAKAPTPKSTAAALSNTSPIQTSKRVHAGPAVRRLARELGVDLAEVKATGPRQRIIKEDVHEYVKQRMTGQGEAVTGSSGLPELPEIDFTKWGDVEREALSKLKRVSAANLHRSWVHIPHVTQFDQADITDLEAFRKSEGAKLKEQGIKLTFLPFLIQAVVKTLQAFPRFNASLSKDGNELIFKKYFNIGIAVDTPEGLVVPVVKNADQLSLVELAEALVTLSGKARDRKLSPADMQGGTFTISSLGGIGGTAFTPIVNWPEVSILGVSRSSQQPVFDNGQFVPRLMLPLSLSYDHRVIDGADAARFTRYLADMLQDIRRVLL